MELRVLQYFLTVAREQTISGAAERLNLTQPTLSRQLKDLEDELGKQLLIRGSRRITLTEEGRLLRERAEEIMALVRKTEQDVTRTGDAVTGEIVIGADDTDALRPIADAFHQLRQLHPRLQLRVMAGDRAALLEQLDRGLLDLAVLPAGADRTRFSALPLAGRSALGLLTPADSPLARLDAVTPDDLRGQPLIVTRAALDQPGFNAWFLTQGGLPQFAAVTALSSQAVLLVRQGLGCALLPHAACTHASLCFRPLQPPIEQAMELVWKKDTLFSRATEALMDLINR